MQGSACSSKSKSSPKSKHDKRLNCERLEDRRMLAVVTVDTELDVVDINDGVTSLREAIFATNTVAGADEIVFDFDHDGPATIFLTEGELQITDDLTINGLGADLLTIDAQQNSRIFNIDDGGVANDFDVTLVGMTLTGGQTLGDNIDITDTTHSGGAIRAVTEGLLEIFNCIITRNRTIGDASLGGAVYASGDVAITDCTVSDNYTLGYFSSGGGILVSGNLQIDNSVIEKNRTFGYASGGGGVFGSIVSLTNAILRDNSTTGDNSDAGGVYAGEISIVDSAVSGNHTHGTKANGGGVFAYNNASIYRSVIASNTTLGDRSFGGGVAVVAGEAEIVESSISNNIVFGNHSGGGGVFLSVGEVQLTRSSLIRNSTAGRFSEGGGIHVSGGTITSLNSTISGNKTFGQASHGGGVYNGRGDVLAAFSTITENSVSSEDATGAGVYLAMSPWSTSRLWLNSSILAGNDSANSGPQSALLISQYSVLGTDVVPDSGMGNIFVEDPRLAPLADNGGPTLPGGAALLTHALVRGSFGTNSGDPAFSQGDPGIPESDQRGLPFERISGGRVDIGAYEVQSTPSPDLNGDGYVDGLDLGILLGHWGQTASPSHGELNFTTPVDGEDLGILLSDWNPVTYLPEPAAVLAASSETQLADAALAWTLASETYAVEQPLVGPQQNVDPLPQDVALATLLPVESEFPERASLWIGSDEEADEIDFADELLQRVFS